MPNNPTEAQQEASRQNGTKSRGPATPEGKARCAQAARDQRRQAPGVVLTNESPDRYRAILEGLQNVFQPANIFESALVARMAAAQWRFVRSLGQQTALTDLEMSLQKDEVAAIFAQIDAAGVQALAFKSLAVHDPRVLHTLATQENSYARQFDRAARLLLESRRRNQKIAQGPEDGVTPDQSVQPLTARQAPDPQDPPLAGSRELPDLTLLETTIGEQQHDNHRYQFTDVTQLTASPERTRLKAVLGDIPQSTAD